MKTTVYMVRHAESPFAFGQERTRGLSEEGFLAAKRVAQFFTDVDIHFIASSPYARAKQTVQYVAEQKGLDIVEYEELIERPIKGLDYKASWDVLYEAIRESFTDKDFCLEGGEPTRKAQQRSIPVIEGLLEERQGQNIIIGTHGNIMTIIMNYFDETYGFEFWDSTSKPDIYKLTFERNRLEQVERLWD
ncbi:histidine phosphatase family protein [Paenibacillus contaminans]|uniref:Histidine phosphatase family protein n=1 Tax=Paenibacillus contaminans TaxID=450362 RepID=A0A329MMK8_9BACL|nr:histidine phosphatase family protein [Paenibacillus contaminans]RAV21119.1 histidine phosphatase family protein [Paenibacillus contaminans]